MKRLLKAIVLWLDRKFPDKVVVNQADYDKLISKVKDLDQEIRALKVAIGFSPGLKVAGNQGPFQR